MKVRSLVFFLTALLGVVAVIVPLSAQTRQPSAESWTPPLTSDGQPDLQGNWVNRSATPLQRPPQLAGREFLTNAEVAELKKRADRIFKDGHSDMPAGDDVFLAALEDLQQYKRSAATGTSDILLEREFDNRTSLIVDPPDGRLPPYTPAAQAKQTAAHNPPAGPEDLSNIERCITFGVPMPRPGPFTSYYQIVQAPGYVVVVMEAIHDARVIPLDGSPHLSAGVRTWNGDSRGHWEGSVLVVDTTNFSPKSNFMGSTDTLHLIERFKRVAPDEIRYEMTIDDPTTWTKPWTAVLRLKRTDDQIYEVACHEGNLEIMEDMLRPRRMSAK